MSEIIGTVSGTIKESIARVELYTDANLAPDDWQLVVHFEKATYDANGNMIGPSEFGSRRVPFRFGDVKDMKIGSSTETIQQLAGKIQKVCYQLRTQDIDREEAMKARREQEQTPPMLPPLTPTP
jgi:hypothetical protein